MISSQSLNVQGHDIDFSEFAKSKFYYRYKTIVYTVIVAVVAILSQFFSLVSLSFLFSRKEAQLDEEGQFLVRIIYDDSKTYDLVAAASKVLSKLKVTFVLWLSYTQKPKGMRGPGSR